MRAIVPNRLWIGNSADARDPRAILETGIRAVVDLAVEEPPPRLTRELIVCRFPIIDGGGNSRDVLWAAIATAALLFRQEVPLLVACSAGMSRSPAVAAAAMAIDQVKRPDTILAEYFEGNPCDLSGMLWLDIKAVCEAMVAGKVVPSSGKTQ